MRCVSVGLALSLSQQTDLVERCHQGAVFLLFARPPRVDKINHLRRFIGCQRPRLIKEAEIEVDAVTIHVKGPLPRVGVSVGSHYDDRLVR